MLSSAAAIVTQNFERVRQQITAACARVDRPAKSVTLVAVTKSVSWQIAALLAEQGVTDLAESRPQVLWEKAPLLGPDIRWHLIGPLQTNKIRRSLPLVSLIHSVDRWNLAEALSAESQRLGKTCAVTLEVNLSGESQKHGFSAESLREAYPRLRELAGLDIRGLMTMARYEANPENCRPTFAALRTLRDQLTHEFGAPLPVLSMGMSNDFLVAIEEGATHVRIGSALFEGLPEE